MGRCIYRITSGDNAHRFNGYITFSEDNRYAPDVLLEGRNTASKMLQQVLNATVVFQQDNMHAT